MGQPQSAALTWCGLCIASAREERDFDSPVSLCGRTVGGGGRGRGQAQKPAPAIFLRTSDRLFFFLGGGEAAEQTQLDGTTGRPCGSFISSPGPRGQVAVSTGARESLLLPMSLWWGLSAQLVAEVPSGSGEGSVLGDQRCDHAREGIIAAVGRGDQLHLLRVDVLSPEARLQQGRHLRLLAGRRCQVTCRALVPPLPGTVSRNAQNPGASQGPSGPLQRPVGRRTRKPEFHGTPGV